jgi:hypothetical protein
MNKFGKSRKTRLPGFYFEPSDFCSFRVKQRNELN